MTLSKREIITEIGRELLLKDKIVEEVINAFESFLIEKIVNDGELKFSKVFKINSVDVAGFETKFGEVPPSKRLIIKLSPTVKTLFKENLKKDLGITRDNWGEKYRELVAGKNEKFSLPEISEKPVEKDFFNPLLDEDD